MKPLGFQSQIVDEVASKFEAYSKDPLLIRAGHVVPFYQAITTITGSGKTLILAECVERLRAHVSAEPIVLWISKGRVVVAQTFADLSDGKYRQNVPSYQVKYLSDFKADDIAARDPVILMATAGKFATSDASSSDLIVYRSNLDDADASVWELLKKRTNSSGVVRPLFVVYDEGHNLSDNQASLLMDLKPEVLLVASATNKMPSYLRATIERLKNDKGWSTDDFQSTAPASVVVRQGLIKKRIFFSGHLSPMEMAVDDMLLDLRKAEKVCKKFSNPFRPKCIYVCSTNVVDGLSIAEDLKSSFSKRRARPIQIWRHLVSRGIDPDEIAIYGDLRFKETRDIPPSFHLFSGGTGDLDRFVSTEFNHVIFNTGLQEGWNDPSCMFAYIDKDMKSKGAITQIVGRVLRQPTAKHFQDPILNTAHFYIRTDEEGTFEKCLREVERNIISGNRELSLSFKTDSMPSRRLEEEPLRQRDVPVCAVETGRARDQIEQLIKRMPDFRTDAVNTVGAGRRAAVIHTVGSGETAATSWSEVAHSNKVTARWIFRKEIQKLFRGGDERYGSPVNLCDIEDDRFDAEMEFASVAADSIRRLAKDVVQAYCDHFEIIASGYEDPYVMGSVTVDYDDCESFKFAVHARYSGLNQLEGDFARELDREKLDWCRNHPECGYSIPVINGKSGHLFYPDFIVWSGQDIYCLDTKGDHLIASEVDHKVFQIRSEGSDRRVHVKLITAGEWEIGIQNRVSRVSEDGMTVWEFRAGKLRAEHCKSVSDAVRSAVPTK